MAHAIQSSDRAHGIWRTLRRPFRYVSCLEHQWEPYQIDEAGCLKCGAMHRCLLNPVDCKCPLVTCDDLSRVCTISGCVLPAVRCAATEYVDTVVATDLPAQLSISVTAIDEEVRAVLHLLLRSDKARLYRQDENRRQARKVTNGLHRALKQAKLKRAPPNVLQCLAEVMHHERNLRFICPASDELVEQACKNIVLTLVELRNLGVRLAPGGRLQGLAVGLLYLLRAGLIYGSHVLLMPMEEIAVCLPFENKLEHYFGISSKAICEVENELKLVFRAHYQRS